MAKIDQIAKDVRVLRERVVERVPGHFDMRHIVTAFLGALLFGFTFVLKGLLFNVGLALNNWHLISITLVTWIILSAEIYFVGYMRVPNKERRPFGQFWAKRIATYYFISIIAAYLLIKLYGLNVLAETPYHVLKLVIAVSFPAAIGAAITDLLGKY